MPRRDPGAERRLWQQTVTGVRRELAVLPTAERAQLAARVARIGALQERLQALFAAAGGAQLCQACDGACCDCGRNHLTLANLLAILLAGEKPPVPDYAAPCPWLGPDGCRLAPARRPFNCVTFLCEAVEVRLGAENCHTFYALEATLRGHYQQLAEGYPGAGRQGLLLRAEALAGRGFLGRR